MPMTTRTPALLEYFAELPDPRIERCKQHQLLDLVVIAILATICGTEHFTEMEEFGIAKQAWLKTFLKLEKGIPTHDTFARVFARLNPTAFQERFVEWVQAINTATAGEVVAIDGKTARRAHNQDAGVKALHLVSAWATHNRLTLGQVKVDEKSNEITAVPQLLQLLALQSCIVTVDALNTQKDIADEIRAQGADYVLALKENHPYLRAEVEGIFDAVRNSATRERARQPFVTQETGHGRSETRRCWSVSAPDWLLGFEQRRDLKSLILVESTRDSKEQPTTELRYYLSSLAPAAPLQLCARIGALKTLCIGRWTSPSVKRFTRAHRPRAGESGARAQDHPQLVTT